MQRDSITAQRGQGWLVSFAVLILIGAVGSVAYTVMNSDKKTSEVKPAQTDTKPDFSDSEIQSIANQLVAKHLGNNTGSHEEDIQALSNTLNNLRENPHSTAKNTLLQLKDDDLTGAVSSLKTLALDSTSKRDAAKLWIDIGNINNLTSTQNAIESYQESVTLDPDNINAWNRIGHLERARKNYAQAEIAYKNVTRLSDDLSQTQALSFANFGLLHQSQNKNKEAVESFTEALNINTQLKNSAGIASNNENLASLFRTLKEYDLAESHYKAAFAIYESEKQTSKLVELHSALGSLHQTRQQTELALNEYEKALTLNQQNPNKRFSASLYSNMGILSQQNNDQDKAESYFNQALTLYQALKQDRGVADQYSNLAILARNKKQFENSEDLHLKAISLYQKEGLTQAVTTQYTNLGFLYTAWNKTETACEYWKKSLTGLTEAAHEARRVRIEAIINRDCKASSQEATELTQPTEEPSSSDEKPVIEPAPKVSTEATGT